MVACQAAINKYNTAMSENCQQPLTEEEITTSHIKNEADALSFYDSTKKITVNNHSAISGRKELQESLKVYKKFEKNY